MGTKTRYFMIEVCCCIFAACSIGIPINCAGLFYRDVSNDLQVGIGSISSYVTIISFVSGVTGPFAIKLLQKYSVKKLLLAASLLTSLCFLGFSRMSSLWQLFLFASLLGIAISFYNMVPIAYFISNWFSFQYGLMIGIAQSFSGLGGALFNKIIGPVTIAYGWRHAYVFIAVLEAALLIPCALVITRSARERNLPKYGEADISKETEVNGSARKEHIRLNSTMIICCVIGGLCCFVTGFPSHLTNMAASEGMGTAIGVSMTSAAMIGNFTSKFVTGFLCDKIGPRKATSVMLGLAIFGFTVLGFSGSRLYMVLIGAAFSLGACYAIHGVGLSSVAKEFFTPSQFALGYSYIQMAAALGSGIAFSAFGYSFDLFKSYKPAILTCIVFSTISLLLFQHLYVRKSRKT